MNVLQVVITLTAAIFVTIYDTVLCSTYDGGGSPRTLPYVYSDSPLVPLWTGSPKLCTVYDYYALSDGKTTIKLLTVAVICFSQMFSQNRFTATTRLSLVFESLRSLCSENFHFLLRSLLMSGTGPVVRGLSEGENNRGRQGGSPCVQGGDLSKRARGWVWWSGNSASS